MRDRAMRVRGRKRGQRAADFVLFQTTIPAYRDAFIRHLLEQSPTSVIWSGGEYFDPTIRISPYAEGVSRHLKNRFLFGRRLEWQGGAFAAARTPSVVVLELNPRILSNWPILVYRHLVGRRTVMWGHAWPRSGARSRTFFLRVPLIRLADAVLVYTENDQAELAARVSTRVFVAPNAVVSSKQWMLVSDGNPTNAVVVGRLVPSKKPALALEAWLSVCGELDGSARLIFVGDGPARSHLESIAARDTHGQRVEFMGEIMDRGTLGEIYADALVSISAGYAGLSLTDSLGYGVPMVIADNEPHAPEISLASPDNSRFFRAGDASSLARELEYFYESRELWISRRPEIATKVRGKYSIEAMVEGFLAAVRGE